MTMSSTIRIPLLVAFALALAPGCQTTRQTTGKDSPVHVRHLRSRLLFFSDRFSAVISATADDIASQTDDRVVREMTLRWKLRTIPTLQDVILTDDPRMGLLDAWMICARQRIYLEEGGGKSALGDKQALALDAARMLEAEIVEVGRTLYSEAEVAEARKEIEAFAEGYPMKGRFAGQLVRASQRITAEAHPGLFGLMSIPIGGLSETAAAIERIAHVAGVFTEIAADLPERMRWQMELALLEAERLDTTVKAVDDFGHLSRAVESLAKSAETLPAELRSECQALLTSTDASVKNIRATIDEARSLVAELEQPVDRTQALAKQLDQAGASWRETAKAVDAAMQTIDGIGDREKHNAEGEKPFQIADLTKAGEATRSAVIEIRALLEDLQSAKLKSTLTGADGAAVTSMNLATDRIERLVDVITLRTILVLSLFLVGLYLVRWATARLRTRPAPAKNTPQPQ